MTWLGFNSLPAFFNVEIYLLYVSVAFRFGLERSSYSVVESDEVMTVCVTAEAGDGSEIYTATLSSINITTQGIHIYTELVHHIFMPHL